jgi:hypothetical protein
MRDATILTMESRTRIISRVVRGCAAAGCAAIVLATAGCAVLLPVGRADASVVTHLQDAIEHGQDLVWHLRDVLLADAEQTIAGQDYIADARPSLADPAVPLPARQYTLLSIAETEGEVAVTFATTAEVTTGGGFFTDSASGTACYTFHLPRDRTELTTTGADCADAAGVSLGRLQPEMRVVPLHALAVRERLTAEDYFIPCQCSSGGDCDCPGG